MAEYERGFARERGTDGRAGSWKEDLAHYCRGMELGSQEAKFKVALCHSSGLNTGLDDDEEALRLKASTMLKCQARRLCSPVSIVLMKARAMKMKKINAQAIALLSHAANDSLTARAASFYLNDPDTQAKGQALFDSCLPKVRELAAAGDVDAAWRMGFCYKWGEGVAKDLSAAIKWYTIAASQGCLHSQYRLAEALCDGIWTIQHQQEAARWLDASFDQGMSRVDDGDWFATHHYIEGCKADEQSSADALMHFEKAVNTATGARLFAWATTTCSA